MSEEYLVLTNHQTKYGFSKCNIIIEIRNVQPSVQQLFLESNQIRYAESDNFFFSLCAGSLELNFSLYTNQNKYF